ncbi:MAG: hypothetical protein JXA11_09485 [Phycisphaerae bacterium]|nr:hypothetical protein [Phycisphaerae bacterium]
MYQKVVLVLSVWVFAQGIQAEDKPSPFYLSRNLKMQFVHKNLDELEQDWPAFQHQPFDKSGFNHLILPFHYEDRSNDGHPNEALSFSFLLSNSLDWSPGCYCSRHAFFVFTRDKEKMQYLAKTYNRKLIGFVVTDWDATHGVGGKLIRTKEGYHGVLQIFDKKGNQVLEKEYDKPRSFFQLLGDMSFDTMACLDVPLSKKLYEYLCMERCKDPQSLIKLGNAAFDQDRMSVYTDILRRDPGFADVRYWWALRKSWVDDADGFYYFQIGRALTSYLIEAAMVVFDPKRCPGKEFDRNFPRQIKLMETLLGSDHPSLLRIRLNMANNERKSDLNLRRRALHTAGQYPNSYYLMRELYIAYGLPPVGYDADMLISLGIAMIRSNYMTGCSSQYIANIKPLCIALHCLGYSGVAGDILLPLCQKDLHQEGLQVGDSWPMEYLADMYFETGQFNEAIRWYRVAFKRMRSFDTDRNKVLGQAAISAALASRQDVIEQILRDRRKELDQYGITPIVKAYRDILVGKEVNVESISELKFKVPNEWKNRQKAIFLTQRDLCDGTQKYRKKILEYALYWPLSHQMWVLIDGYERQEPSTISRGFYHALEWLFPEDVWVKQAVADYRKRTSEEDQNKAVSVEELMAILKPYPPQRYPKDTKKYRKFPKAVFMYSYADYAYAIKRLIDKRDFKQARELALRFNTMMSGFKITGLRYLANHLIHRIDQAEEKAKPKIFVRRERGEGRDKVDSSKPVLSSCCP